MMGFLRKLFGRKTTAFAASTLAASTSVAAPSTPAAPSATQRPADPSQDPNLIRVFDAYGRELFITKQQWRDSVLLGHIETVWNQPNELYATIVQSLQDGFGADMIRPAEQLAKIDPDKERGAVVLAIVYREQKRLADSERILRGHLAAHGASGIVLTNLAKVQADRGENALALETLWRGLELDPNQDNGLVWYAALFREKKGPAGYEAALRRIAALPGSWRARVWLAREALLQKDVESALKLYDEAIALAPRPAPTDLLQQISGDLGNQGHLPEILRLIGPLFQIELHGLAVGNNLIKANLDLGRLDVVQSLLTLHYAQKRLDWKEALGFWDTELAKARASTATPQPDHALSIAMLVCSGPLWLPADSPAAELFPVAPGPRIRVAFLGSSAELAAPGDQPRQQMSDAPGRLSRAIPQFLAQEVYFHGRTDVRTLVPWMTGENPAFVFSGGAWRDEDAAGYARPIENPSDYLVVRDRKSVV